MLRTVIIHKSPTILLGIMFATFCQPLAANAGRPLVIDDAAAVAPSHLEIELGLTQLRPHGGGREQQWPVATAAYGVGKGLELGLGIQRISQDLRGESPVQGFEDLHLTAKYNFLTEGGHLPDAALSLDIKVPTANRGKGLTTGSSDQNLILILSKSYAPVSFHLNLGYLIVDSPSGEKLKNRIHGGAAVEWPFRDRWTLVGEILGAARESRGAPNEADFQAGFRYQVSPRLTFDAAAGRSLRAVGTQVQGTIGLTLTFDVLRLLTAQP